MKKLSTPSRFILIIIGGLFVSEMISMSFIGAIDHDSYLLLSIIDSTLMVLLATPLLYYFSLRPLLQVISEREAEITQRKQIESQLRIQTKALETAANGVVVTDKEGKILWANQAFARMTGYSLEEVVGKKPDFLNSGTHDSEFFKRLWGTILAGDVWYGEVTNRRKNGDLCIDEQTITPVFNSAGEIENFIAIQQDITDRKRDEIALRESEEKFRTFVDWTYDWEAWLDPEERIVYTSPSCGRITGFSHDEFIRDADLLIRIVHPEDRKLYQDHQDLVHNEMVGPLSTEFRIIAKDGHERWIEHNCRPLYGRDNRYLGRRVSNRDITERKNAEKTIKEREQKENILTTTIHSMQMDIARDLHDTVGQNISYLRMKLDHLSGMNSLRDDEMLADIKRMSEVANDSYDLIRGTLAVLQSENSADLARLFSRYASQIEERSSFKVRFSSKGMPSQFSAKRMRQLFYIYREALNNIEKHAEASEVSIELAWNHDHLSLNISDNGCGFDTMNNIKHGGSYGLKFMQDRVDLLDGELILETSLGVGTKLKINVPLG